MSRWYITFNAKRGKNDITNKVNFSSRFIDVIYISPSRILFITTFIKKKKKERKGKKRKRGKNTRDISHETNKINLITE